MNHWDVVVVGCGVAGLHAAATLTDRGLRVLVLEKNGLFAGGRVAAYPKESFQYRGRSWEFSMEHGIHCWWRQYRNFRRFLDVRGLSDRLVKADEMTMLYYEKDRVHRANVGRKTLYNPIPEPLHLAPMLYDPVVRRLIGWRDLPKLPALCERLIEILAFDPNDPELTKHYDGRSLKSFFPGLPLIFRAFMNGLCRSGFFCDPPEVSLWAFLLALQLYVFLRKEDQEFYFARGNIVEEIFDPVIAAMEARGSRLCLGARLTGLKRRTGGDFELAFEADTDAARELLGGATGTLCPGQVVLAVDVEAARALSHGSPEIAQAIGDISAFEGRAATNVRLWWAKSPTLEYGESGMCNGVATADNFLWLHRFQPEFRAFHEQTGGSLSESHIYAPASMHRKSNEELVARVKRDMERAFPEVAGSLVHAAVIKNEATHINFPVGCAGSFPTVQTPVEGLFLAGDWIDGGSPVLYMERAAHTGICAANGVLKRRGLPCEPELKPEPPPAHVIAVQKSLRAVVRAGIRRGFIARG